VIIPEAPVWDRADHYGRLDVRQGVQGELVAEWWSQWYEDEHGNGWRYTEDDEGNWEEEAWGPDMDNGGGSGCLTTLAPAAAVAACGAALVLGRR
jgi:hypothetical protein